MFVTKTLEVIIALTLIYFLLSNFTSILFEWYSYKTQKRGKFLFETITKLLNDKVNQSYGPALYSHFLIDSLKKDEKSFPQYIPESAFSNALVDIISSQSNTHRFDIDENETNGKTVKYVDLTDYNTDLLERFKSGLDTMQHSKLKQQLRYFAESSNSLDDLLKHIEIWYKNYMQRVTGWYKKSTRSSLMIFGLSVAFICNFNSLEFIQTLYKNDEIRLNLVNKAEKKIEDLKELIEKVQEDDKKQFTDKFSQNDTLQIKQLNLIIAKFKIQIKELQSDKIPLGYNSDFLKEKSFLNCILWFVGVLITGIALSFGAPFWFDIMSKTVNIRRAGIKS